VVVVFKSALSTAVLLSSRRDWAQVTLDLGLAVGAVFFLTMGALFFLNPEFRWLLGLAH